MRIEIHTQLDDEIQKFWSDLEDRSNLGPFQSFGWVKHWLSTVGLPVYDIEVFVVCIFVNEHIEAILPMGIVKKNKFSKLEWLGGIHCDYMGPLVAEDSIFFYSNFNSIWREVLTALPKIDVVSFRNQPLKLGSQNNPFCSMRHSREYSNSYQANFEGSWSQFKGSISKKVLNDSIRQRKRLSSLGILKFVVLDKSEDKSLFYKKLFAFKSLRYAEMGVEDILKPKEHKDFYLGMPESINKFTSVHCAALMLDDEIIALHWGVIQKKTFYYLMPANSSGKWSKYSPGKLLLEELLFWCHENKISIFDFTSGDEMYKKIWTNASLSLINTLTPITLKGYIYVLLENLKLYLEKTPFIRSMIKKLYENLRGYI